MATFKNINEKPPRYQFIDSKCIGRYCFHPVVREGGRAGCNNRMNHGCPDPLPDFVQVTAIENRMAGWRLA